MSDEDRELKKLRETWMVVLPKFSDWPLKSQLEGAAKTMAAAGASPSDVGEDRAITLSTLVDPSGEFKFYELLAGRIMLV